MVTIEPIDCSGAGELYLPNAFSPNGDGENDVLQLYYGNMQCITTFELQIYDRWGEKVFQTTDPDFSWDGYYKGTVEGTAVFVYYMKAKLIIGGDLNKKGNVSLIR
jgi:gliding motility-associated-like protein